VVEILGSLLSGAVPYALDSSSGYKHYFAAYNIAAFTDVEQFKENMDQMLRSLRSTKTAQGHDRVLYPGLLEYEEEQERRSHGIPLHKEVVNWFGKITSELGIPPLGAQ
jgi:LDH2 family malate/lactate/ureidoglycolate dehydrogenase